MKILLNGYLDGFLVIVGDSYKESHNILNLFLSGLSSYYYQPY